MKDTCTNHCTSVTEVKDICTNHCVTDIPTIVKCMFIVYYCFLLGVFQTRCLGFYCGYCPLAIVMTFANNYIQCKILANQTALNTGTIKINLADWVLQPGYYDVKVYVKLFLITGYCSSINCSSSRSSKDHLFLIQCYYRRKPKLN